MTNETDAIDICSAAIAWHNGGAAILPVADDKTKRPAIPWKQYQTTLPTDEEAETWFGPHNPRYSGLGVVCGAVSGHLELLEFEGRAVTEGLPAQMKAAMEKAGEADLWDLVTIFGYMD